VVADHIPAVGGTVRIRLAGCMGLVLADKHPGDSRRAGSGCTGYRKGRTLLLLGGSGILRLIEIEKDQVLVDRKSDERRESMYYYRGIG
jgi:hypothetical protein